MSGQYVSDKPNNFRTELGASIFRSKYALTPDETWLQRCTTIVDDVCGTRGGATHPLMSKDERTTLVNLMHNFVFLPGGRYIYYAGRGLSFYNNCFGAETNVLTDAGWANVAASVGQTLNVLSPVDGKYYPATFNAHGVQQLQTITFAPLRGRSSKRWTVRATQDHRWFLKNGTTTCDLRVGDMVPANAYTPDTDPVGFAHGFVFGDGNANGQLRLCGVKQQHLDVLASVATSVTYPQSNQGDPAVYFSASQNGAWKLLPDPASTPAYIASFISGWLAADGHIKRDATGSIMMASVDRAHLEWLERHAAFAGLVVVGEIRAQTRDVQLGAYTYNDHTLHILNLQRGEDFSGFKVLDITPDADEEVFCPFEPVHEQIVIDNGIHTSNCFLFKGNEDTREEWGRLLHSSSDALMSGGGIGTDYSVFRPKGSLLKRTGGTASGPLPLAMSVNEHGRNVKQGGSRRCLPEGTMVSTSLGLKKIENIVVGDEVLTFDGYHSVNGFLDQGSQQTITIKSQIGEFVCTPNHRVARLTSVDGDYEWVEARNLAQDDRLVFVDQVLPGYETEYPEYKYGITSNMSTTCVDIAIPEFDTEQAWLLGYLHGNGYIYRGEAFKGCTSFSVPKIRPEIADRVEYALAQFGANVKRRDGSGEYWVISASSVQLADFFSQFKVAKEPLEVPEIVLCGTPDIRAAYVAGVFDADGSSDNHPVSILATVYKPFLYQIQAVCASLGFATRAKLSRPAVGVWQPLYILSVSGKKQVARFGETVASYSCKVPKHRAGAQNAYSYVNVKFFDVELRKRLSLMNWPRNQAVIQSRVEDVLGSLPYTPVKVIGLSDGPVVQTYDISVADRNEFVANGLLVHNSAIYGSLNWQHGDATEWLYAKDWANIKVPGTDVSYAEAKKNNFDAPAPLDFTNISLNYDNAWLSQIAGEELSGETGNQFSRSSKWAKVVETAKLPQTYLENVRMAMYNGEPGFSFNFFSNERATLRNACTEVTSDEDSDMCNIGSVNMAACPDIGTFKIAVELGSKFLICGTLRGMMPDERTKAVREKNRRIGLGLMGVHEWLLQRSYSYDMNDELRKWMKVYSTNGEAAAREHCDRFYINHPVAYRAIAPTGTIGTLAGTTTGMEPIFAVAYKRRYIEGNRETGQETRKYQYYIDSAAKDLMDRYGIAPDKIESALDLAYNPERRVAFQADIQDYVDMAISSTLNLPEWGSEANNLAMVPKFARIIAKYAPRLRGLTMYPDGSRGGQPLVSVPLQEAMEAGVGVVYEENSDTACKSGVCGI